MSNQVSSRQWDIPENYLSLPDKNGCRKWLGKAFTPEGRALVYNPTDRKMKLVTRLLLSRKLKRKLKISEEACHSCDNPWCVEPEHLWAGSHRENMIDRNKKKGNYQVKGTEHPNNKLTKKQVLKIRMSNDSQTSLAKRYKVSQATISSIQLRKTWRHI